MSFNPGTTKYLSFKGTDDFDEPPKVGFESLASPGQVITVSTLESFDSNREPYSSTILQTDIGRRQAGSGYKMTTFIPKRFDANSINRTHDKNISSNSNITSQGISVNMGSSFAHQSALRHQSLEAKQGTIVPIPLVPTNNTFVGTTDLRNASKPIAGPAQLTIFYAGLVCVYDDVSPEKAQAIMLLAGNGTTPTNAPIKTLTLPPTPPPTAIITRLETQTQRPMSTSNGFVPQNKILSGHLSSIPSPTPISISVPRPSNFASDGLSAIPSPIPISVSIPRRTSDGFVGHEPRKKSQFSTINFASPVSVSSRSASGSTDVTDAKSLVSMATPSNDCESFKVVYSQSARASTTSTTTPHSAVPQARKASLARFMEKRKERAVTIAPYPNPGKELPECVTPRSESRTLSMTSAGSFPLSSAK